MCLSSLDCVTKPRTSRKRISTVFIIIIAIVISLSVISYSNTNRYVHLFAKSAIKPALLAEISTFFSYSELTNLAHYIAFGPNISTISASTTFPIPIESESPKILHYIRWHAQEMKCIRDISCYNQRRHKIRIMIWKCPRHMSSACNGVGDRFRGIVSSLVIAMLSKQVFLLSWPVYPYPFLTAVAPGAIDWRVPDHIEERSWDWGVVIDAGYPHLAWVKCPPNLRCKNGRSLTNPPKSESNTIMTKLNVTDKSTFDILNMVGNYIIQSRGGFSRLMVDDAHWMQAFGKPEHSKRKHNSFYTRRVLLRMLFRPSPITERILRHFVNAMATKDGYLAIHARTGVDVGEVKLGRFKNFHESLGTMMAEHLLRCVQRRDSEPKYIYFSSDSVILKRAFREVCRKNNIEVMYSDLPAIHIGKRSSDTNRESRYESVKTWFAFLNIFVDLFGLANGTDILSNRSQFSDKARLISNTSNISLFSFGLNKTICSDPIDIG